MAKSNSDKENYGLMLSYAGIEQIEGTLISVSESGVKFHSRKPSASTMLTQFYPAQRVVALMGKLGEASTIYVRSDSIPIFRAGKKGKERPLSVIGVSQLGDHLLQTSSDDFPIVLVDAKLAKLSGEEKDENAPKRGRKAAGESGGKKAKVKEKKPKGTVQKKDEWTGK